MRGLVRLLGPLAVGVGLFTRLTPWVILPVSQTGPGDGGHWVDGSEVLTTQSMLIRMRAGGAK